MEPALIQVKDPSKNHYIEKLHTHELLLKSPQEVWNYFEGKESVVDLGCGNGHFLESYLTKHPELSGLGVDLRNKRLFKTAEKVRKSSAKVFYGDVPEFVAASPSHLWKEVWMMFPDPWPKKRHAKNRMIDFRFFLNVFRMLRPEGRFCFISDHKAYWDFFLSANSKARLFPITKSQEGDMFPDLGPSLFKRRFQQKQLPIFSLEFRKLK